MMSNLNTEPTQNALSYLSRNYPNQNSWRHTVGVLGRCRVRTATSLKEWAVRQDIVKRKKECPFDEKDLGSIKSPIPMGEMAEAAAVRAFPKECDVCRKKPTISDFDIR